MKIHAINRAEKLVSELEGSDTLEPNTVVYNSLMSAWVKAKNPAAVGRTEEILRQMELSIIAKPDLVSYNTYLHALSIHSSPKRPDLSLRAETLLRRMTDEYNSGVLSFAPNTFTYNLVLESICRGPQDPRTVTRAAKLLREMIHNEDIEPDTFSFNLVLTLLSKSTTPASNVEELFRHMDDSYSAGTYIHAQPNAASFHAVMVAYSRNISRSTAEHVERLINEMKRRASDGEDHIKPNRLCYNVLIDCWAKSGEGTYAARKAEAILQELQDNFFAGDIDAAPNSMTYNAVLNAWAKSGTRCCGYKAEKYLNQMWQQYNAGNTQVKPNDFSYNTVINAISKSKHKEKGQKALRVLRRMDKMYLAGNKEARPNEITYTAVINSCAFPSVRDSRTRRKAFDTAIFTLKELQGSRYGQPNQVTYGTFIRACSNLLHDDYTMRRVIIKSVFEQCCKDGQVGQMVLNYVPKDLYGELLDGYAVPRKKISMDDVPLEWKRNIDDKIRWGAKRKLR
jgi:Pentatricopeptide repeat domain